ncbi:hypothetical protein L195_g039674, partial [Trifolium pratense]
MYSKTRYGTYLEAKRTGTNQHILVSSATNGSTRGKPGLACIGGILQNNRGCVLAHFAASVGVRDSNEAEFMAIVFALELYLDNQRKVQAGSVKYGSCGRHYVDRCTCKRLHCQIILNKKWYGYGTGI